MEALERALRLNPLHAPWRLEMGRLLEKRGDLERAEASVQEALRLEPLYGDAALEAGRLSRLRGDDARAAERLGALFKSLPGRPSLPPAASPYARAILDLDAGRLAREMDALSKNRK